MEPQEFTDKDICILNQEAEEPAYSFITVPKYIGRWEMHDGDISFHVSHKRPNFVVRFFTRLLLGWVWVDEESISR